MLLKYIVSNFKSIGRPVEFSMMPANENIDKKFITELKTQNGNFNVLRRGAFFGPNASGKSAFIESIDFATNYIIEPQKSGNNTRVPQFKGDFEDLQETSLFQFVFYLDKDIFEYGFTLTPKRVSEEWLMIRDENVFVPLFTRVTDANGITKIDIEDNFDEDKHLANVLKSSIKENQKNHLFLYKLKENGIQRAEKIIDWFENIKVIFPYSRIQGLPIQVKEDEKFKQFLSESLARLDTGVSSVSVSQKEIDFQEFAEKINLDKEIIAEVENNKSGIFTSDGRIYVFFEKDDKTMMIQLQFEHKLNDALVNFNVFDESEGTQRLLDLLPILFQMDKRSNAIYFVDEIDRSLHTKLSKHILKTFLKNSNNLYSQMIFTAHDVNLINLNDFAKDEIWFIEKNYTGQTSLKPFSDFYAVSDKHDIVKDYLNGRFGAVPVIRGEV